MSSLGWIDFSASDRRRVHNVLAMMKDEGTLDELGVGQIRDAYADVLFPGFTTIQTRARYFLAIPRLMLDWAALPASKRDARPLTVYLRDAENKLAKTLRDNYRNIGKEPTDVIGHTAVDQGGVARRPSSTYWNGLRVFGIVQTDKSLTEFCRHWRRDADNCESVTSDEGSNDDDHRYEAVVRRPPGPPGGWPDGMLLDLTAPEAKFLRERFTLAPGLEDTVAAQLMSHGLAKTALKNDHASFAAFSTWAAKQKTTLSVACRDNIERAQRFSLAIEGAHIIFNRLISENKTNNNKLVDRCASRYPSWRAEASAVGIFHEDAVRQWLSANEASGSRVKPLTCDFLKRWNALNSVAHPRQSALDELVSAQAVANKPKRSLLLREPEAASWYGMGALDYRWQTARRMLEDITKELPC
jgi:hypothetical protein